MPTSLSPQGWLHEEHDSRASERRRWHLRGWCRFGGGSRCDQGRPWTRCVQPDRDSGRSPPSARLLASLTVLVVASLRLVLSRRALRSRVQFELLPADTFDPSLDAIRRFARQLARTRRGFLLGWLERPGSVWILLAPDRHGVLHYRLEVPQRASTALEAGADCIQPPGSEGARPVALFRMRGHTVRMELRLAHEPWQPLGDPGLDPDPLQGIAGVLGRLHGPAEGALVAIDLLPKTPAQSRRLRKRLLKDAARKAGVQSAMPLEGDSRGAPEGWQAPCRGRCRPAVSDAGAATQARCLRPAVRHSDPDLRPRPPKRSGAGTDARAALLL